jgi:Concanavalin A-like lectin/glucanases superfamily
MAARTATSSDFYRRTTNLIDYTLPYTVMMWVNFQVNTGGDQTAHSINSGNFNSFDLFGAKSNMATRFAVRSNSGSLNDLSGTVLSLNTWYHLTMRRNAVSDADLLLNGIVDLSSLQSTTVRDPLAAQDMGIQVTAAPANFKFAAVKEFNVALTDAQIKAEIWQYLPKIADSRLQNWCPVTPGATERSASLRGVDWNQNGTITDESGPPITWGSGAVILPFIPAGSITPVLSSPTGTQTGSTTASGTVSTDQGNGTLFFIATVNSSETAATIKAGNSQAVTTSGIQNVSVSGLTPSTTYFMHYVHDNGSESNVVTSASFTTDAAGGFISAWANNNTLVGGM